MIDRQYGYKQLYPSVFRALNMVSETIVGQLRLDYTDEEIESKQKLEKMSLLMHG